jgi:hypothetical protein
MTYRDRFTASEERAHYQNIATKILREVSDLRSRGEASPTAPKRWIWELIQNAKDVHIGGKVKIKIETELDGDHPHMTFMHNGQPFSADNIRFLIEQISTKDRKKDETGKQKTTGKFGTGFLTTHLLSEVVFVQGIAKEPDLEYRQFELVLDRSGFELDAITEAVKIAKSSVQDLDDKPPYPNYVAGDFNTAFRYTLADDFSRTVARAGLADLDVCLPYTLVFVSEIETVEVYPRKYSLQKKMALADQPDGNVYTVSVLTENAGRLKEATAHSLVVLCKGFTSIAVPVSLSGDTIEIVSCEHVPRLFCDFPLLGTESFPFPVIINNPNFNPTDPRDGVFLTQTQRPNPQVEENKAIMKEAVALYFALLKYASENSWGSLHFLAAVRPIPADINWVDPSWYRNEVLAPIRKVLLSVKIVRTATDNSASILADDGAKYIWFPTATKKEIRDNLWLCCSSWFPHRLPRRTDVDVWHELVWDECGKLTVAQLAEFVESKGTLDALSKELSGKDVYDWLNEFYALLKLDEADYDSLINKRRLFPNQNGQFCKQSDLHRDAGDIDAAFKDILGLLRHDLRDQLLAPEIEEGFGAIGVRDQAHAVKEITSQVEEKTADRVVATSFRPAFRRLLLWFRENTTRAETLFPILYRRKHLLYDDEEILQNIEKAEQLSNLLSEFKVGTVEELRNMLTKKASTSQLLPVTEDILATTGITSLEEWTEALKDKDLALLFSHKSTPTTDMFVYVQSLIAKTNKRIIAHLQGLDSYDVTEVEETAPTVLSGILKDGRPLTIVARPAYGGEVIIYYGSERDVLDFEDSELWVDDGQEPRRITLGHILKTAQIRRFPV